MHKVFISYHHANDQNYKESLLRINDQYKIFIDGSVDTGDISDDLDDQSIREKIRDEYLRDTSVTILLVGTETKRRKHIDWEIYSSMFDGKKNKKSGLLVIHLPSTGCTCYTAAHDKELEVVYPTISGWIRFTERRLYDQHYPYLPDRIIDNLLMPKVKVSVTNWDRINATTLSFLIDAAYTDRQSCEYDLGRPMRKADS